MDGAWSIKLATGDWTVYPGHALTVAWEIMSVYPSPDEALALVTDHGLNCPAAVADVRITGAGVR